MSSFTIVLLICGLVFFVTGVITHFFPPKKINWYYGYRTRASMKNQEVWDKAQFLTSRWSFILGAVYTLIALTGFSFEVHEVAGSLLAMVVLAIGVVALFMKEEGALKKTVK